MKKCGMLLQSSTLHRYKLAEAKFLEALTEAKVWTDGVVDGGMDMDGSVGRKM